MRELNRETAARVLSVVDAGLVNGMGSPEPGKMCAARDKELASFAEGVVQILIAMKAPGCRWLDLTEAA